LSLNSEYTQASNSSNSNAISEMDNDNDRIPAQYIVAKVRNDQNFNDHNPAKQFARLESIANAKIQKPLPESFPIKSGFSNVLQQQQIDDQFGEDMYNNQLPQISDIQTIEGDNDEIEIAANISTDDYAITQ
jgi:hypothetical protein